MSTPDTHRDHPLFTLQQRDESKNYRLGNAMSKYWICPSNIQHNLRENSQLRLFTKYSVNIFIFFISAASHISIRNEKKLTKASIYAAYRLMLISQPKHNTIIQVYSKYPQGSAGCSGCTCTWPLSCQP